MDLGTAVLVSLQFFYLLWPLLVVLYLFRINRARIDKPALFLVLSFIANYLVFSVGLVAFLGLSAFIAALTMESNDSMFLEFLILILGIACYVIVLALHVLVGNMVVEKWVSRK